ncbi:peptidoglycan-binding protein [Vannielia litorea]|uniref:peptidoglycan-binding domain-containing protein n=1 Tax=Vannielia litorea TaxID=1217970 RepID=UPI001C95FDCD|nr:peptidoglycan-binding protein [Vannielia litorea]MBY6153365.1 peptidoglycan-binding protein [Vannielia litorea]
MPHFDMPGYSRVLPAISLSIAVGFAGSIPTEAQADRKGIVAGAIIGAVIACSASKSKCGTKKKRVVRKGSYGSKSKSRSGGGYGLSSGQRESVQVALQSMGFYTGRIDGSFGRGTQGSIREYQDAIGAPVTGTLSKPQINDLLSLAPPYAGMPADDVRLFSSVAVNDLERSDLMVLQERLNLLGFNAGPVDGSMGGKTRRAIADFKSVRGIPGPNIPSRRLLAAVTDGPMPVRARPGTMAGAATGVISPAPGSKVSLSAGLGSKIGTDESAPTPFQAMPTGEKAVAGALVEITEPGTEASSTPGEGGFFQAFDILGMGPGMSADDFKHTMSAQLGEGLTFTEIPASETGAPESFAHAIQVTRGNWGEPMSQRVLALFPDETGDAGALAIFRMLVLPEDVDDADFEADILPGLVANYGEEALVPGTLLWLGDPAARTKAKASLTAALPCGNLRLSAGSADPSAAFLRVETETVATTTEDCGDVLSVSHHDGALWMSLWDTAGLLEAANGPTSTAEAGGGLGIKF